MPRPARSVVHALRSPRHAAPLLAAALLLGALPAGPAAAGADVTLVAQIGWCNVSSSDLPAGTYELRLRNANGEPKAKADVVLDALGPIITCLPKLVVGGDELILRQGGQVLVKHRIPRIKLSVNRATDAITVTGTPGSSLELRTWSCPGWSDCDPVYEKSVTIPADGSWSRDLTFVHDLKGYDEVDLMWSGPTGRTYLDHVVPYLQIRVGASNVTGSGRPGAPMTVTLKSAGGVPKAALSRKAGPDGAFSGTLRDNGVAVKVALGDRVRSTIASDASLKAIATLLQLTGDIDSLAGTCPKLSPYMLTMTSPGGGTIKFRYGTTDASGDWIQGSIDLDSHSGWTATIMCITARGDRVVKVTKLR